MSEKKCIFDIKELGSMALIMMECDGIKTMQGLRNQLYKNMHVWVDESNLTEREKEYYRGQIDILNFIYKL